MGTTDRRRNKDKAPFNPMGQRSNGCILIPLREEHQVDAKGKTIVVTVCTHFNKGKVYR